MRVFQTLHKYAPYIPNFESRYNVKDLSFMDHLKLLIQDRFYGLHLLKPVLDLDFENTFYTIWNYEELQRKWAVENGIPNASINEILWAQVEQFKPDVFYNASPTFFSENELKQLDSKIKKVCWASSPLIDNQKLSNYHLRLTNFPGFIEDESSKIVKTEIFEPAYDPIMNSFYEERKVDLFFYGQYLDAYFKNRNRLIDQLIQLKEETDLNIKICLLYNRKSTPIINIPFVRRYLKKTVYPSHKIIKESEDAVYGIELYKNIAKSKIVFNCAVDFTGNYKVNMRNFETLGLGALMISDEGQYPKGFKPGEHFDTYKNFDDFKNKLYYYLENEEKRKEIALAGNQFIKDTYNKDFQWNEFKRIVSTF